MKIAASIGRRRTCGNNSNACKENGGSERDPYPGKNSRFAITTFQGRKLLDGSLDFTKTFTAGAASVRDLQINQAGSDQRQIGLVIDRRYPLNPPRLDVDSHRAKRVVAASGQLGHGEKLGRIAEIADNIVGFSVTKRFCWGVWFAKRTTAFWGSPSGNPKHPS